MVRTSPDAETDVIAGVPGALEGAGQSDEAGPELVHATVDGLGLGLGLGLGVGVPAELVEPQAETITTSAASTSRNTVI